MSEQEMRSKMEFIVDQQARLVVDLQMLTKAHAKAEARLSKAEEKVGNHDPRIAALESVVITVVGLVGDSVKSQKATEETVKTLVERVDALTERLDAIINLTIERTLGDQNGNGTGKDGND
ncbi:MAG: hypothetical protein ACREAB_02565 [Blastocatellia bacterium]